MFHLSMTETPLSFAETPEDGGFSVPHTGALARKLLCSARGDMQKPQLRRIF